MMFRAAGARSTTATSAVVGARARQPLNARATRERGRAARIRSSSMCTLRINRRRDNSRSLAPTGARRLAVAAAPSARSLTGLGDGGAVCLRRSGGLSFARVSSTARRQFSSARRRRRDVLARAAAARQDLLAPKSPGQSKDCSFFSRDRPLRAVYAASVQLRAPARRCVQLNSKAERVVNQNPPFCKRACAGEARPRRRRRAASMPRRR